MPAEFVDDTLPAGPAIATCAGCGNDILGGTGITVTADGSRFHPACRHASKPPKPRRQRAPRTDAAAVGHQPDEVLGA